MNAAPAGSRTWPRRRFVFLTALILAGQIGLIFWLGARKAESRTTTATGPMIYLPADQSTDLPGVSDPTLFVLPNSRGFSGPAWMQFPAATYPAEAWTEPPRPLPLAIPQLGATLTEAVRASRPRPFELALKPEPELDALGYLPLEEAQSTYTIEGDLAGRALLAPLTLFSPRAAEILAPTEVQIAVDADGRVFSTVLLPNKSASAEANTNALNIARNARFAPLRRMGAGPPPAPDSLTWGKLVFHWHTVPPPAAPPAAK